MGVILAWRKYDQPIYLSSLMWKKKWANRVAVVKAYGRKKLQATWWNDEKESKLRSNLENSLWGKKRVRKDLLEKRTEDHMRRVCLVHQLVSSMRPGAGPCGTVWREKGQCIEACLCVPKRVIQCLDEIAGAKKESKTHQRAETLCMTDQEVCWVICSWWHNTEERTSSDKNQISYGYGRVNYLVQCALSNQPPVKYYTEIFNELSLSQNSVETLENRNF